MLNKSIEGFISWVKFISPVIRWTAPFWGHIGTGIYEHYNGESLDVSLITNPIAWAWFLGTITGFFILDITRPNRNHSFLLSLWDNRKNPLSFEMHLRENMLPTATRYHTTVGATIYNSAPMKRKNVCVVSRESRGCNSPQRSDIEFCLNIAGKSRVFLPMFELKSDGAKTEYRVVPDYLKSNRVSTEWCDMNESSFMFKPCFSDDMNQEECLRLCTVGMPNENRSKLELIEKYYAEDEEEFFALT